MEADRLISTMPGWILAADAVPNSSAPAAGIAALVSVMKVDDGYGERSSVSMSWLSFCRWLKVVLPDSKVDMRSCMSRKCMGVEQ